jgi:hypothetical protein
MSRQKQKEKGRKGKAQSRPIQLIGQIRLMTDS